MPIPKPRFIALLPLAALLLSACSITPKPVVEKSPDSPQWLAHKQRVEAIRHFQTRGAFAYLSDDQKVYARFNWQQIAPDNYRLLLTSPLGSTELELSVTPERVQLTDRDGKRYVANDAEEMIEKLTGMPIPIENLRLWILGLPGDASQYTLDDQYRLKTVTFEQQGKQWTVQYADYDSKIQPSLPSNMELREGDLRIKLKMDNWTVTP